MALRPARTARPTPPTDRRTRDSRIGTHPNRARIRRLAPATPHSRTPTHRRTRRRKPSTTQPDRTPARTAPRQPHRRHPRHGHRPRHKYRAHATKQSTKPKITLARLSSAFSRRSLRSTSDSSLVCPRPRAGVDLGLANPFAHRFRSTNTQQVSHPAHRLPLRDRLAAQIGDHLHRPRLQFLRIPPR